MGVLNVTPNSFFDGGRYLVPDQAIRRAEAMAEEGADILDVGGESTRPGVGPVPPEEEKRRILPVIREIVKKLKTPVSVDTRNAETAQAALGEGASIVNDVGGLLSDPDMARVAASYGAGVVVMHMRGIPTTMQDSPRYADLIQEIKERLKQGIKTGLGAGMGQDQFLIDPGIGFGKTFDQNIEIIKNLTSFLDLNKPILIGLSRKSFLGRISGLPAEERLEGSLAVAVIAVLNGASVLRTHDVKETKRAVEMADRFRAGER